MILETGIQEIGETVQTREGETQGIDGMTLETGEAIPEIEILGITGPIQEKGETPVRGLARLEERTRHLQEAEEIRETEEIREMGEIRGIEVDLEMG